jgi:hypothetical protein
MNNIKMRAILLSATPYSYEVKKDGPDKGKIKEGLPIQYYNADNLQPIKDEENGTYGIEVMSDFLPYSELANIAEVPGVYELSCGMVNTRDQFKNVIGKIKVNTLKFIGPVHSPAKG